MLPPQLGTIRIPRYVIMTLEDRDAQVGPHLPLRPPALLPLAGLQRAFDPVIMLSRDLTAGDSDVAVDPLLGIDDPMESAERLLIDPIRSTDLAGMAGRIGRVKGSIEESEIHRLEEGIGPLSERGAGVADHDKARREPAVIDAGRDLRNFPPSGAQAAPVPSEDRPNRKRSRGSARDARSTEGPLQASSTSAGPMIFNRSAASTLQR